MQLTYEQIERLYNDMIGGFVEIEASDIHNVECIRVIPNDDADATYYLNKNGETL